MEDLSVMWKKLSFTEEEGSEYSGQAMDTLGKGHCGQVSYTTGS